jgi:hypothetical protein
MERPLLEVIMLRVALAALPFAIWFAARAWMRRSGRDVGATPWYWLAAAGALLVGVSLLATALFHRDNRGEVYVPAEVTADGRVTEGHFEKKAPAKP